MIKCTNFKILIILLRMNLLRIVMVILLQARGGIEQDVLEAYCWMYSTWNIPKEYKGACSGGDQVC